jgi:hypothetical protein
MSTSTRTPSEAKVVHVAAMGAELGALYSALWQEVAWIHSKWAQYVALFGTKPERVELLNKAAPAFFRLVQDTLWENVILHIARLTDSPQSVGKPNLSIKRVPALVTDSALKARIEALVTFCVSSAEFSRDWRNRHLAHRDLQRATADVADPLLPASRAKVKGVLANFCDLLNALSQHYLDSTSFFDVSGTPGDAEELLYVLDDGLKMDAARKERRRNGTHTPEDYEPRSL